MKNEAKYKEYHILIEDNNSVKILSSEEPLTPVKPKLREIAEEINFDVEESWNTQTLGAKLVDHLHKMSECKKNEGKAIVINRMYVGDYLSSNLGHEVINMYTADNGKHYLYLNAYGSFAGKWQGKLGYMLLTKYHSKDCVEVIGKAIGLHDVYNHDEDGSNTNKAKEISPRQFKFIEHDKVSYGNVPLKELFSNAERQSVYITFKADKVFKLNKGKSIFIYYIPQGQNPEEINKQSIENTKIVQEDGIIVIHLEESKLALASLDQFFIPENGDYQELFKLINSDKYKDYWVELGDNDKINLSDTYEPRNKSLFDICKIQNDENCFSNALEYFARKYPQLWGEFFKFGQCRSYSNLSSVEYIGIDLKLPFSVVREQDTKIKDSNSGRIDLFVSNEEHYIVLENKIKSDINKVDSDSDDCTQLNRYVKYVEHKNECSEKKKTPHYFILTPNYNIPKIIEEKMKEKYKIITYKELYEFFKNRDEVEEDINFKAFFNAIKRHTRDNVNDYLYYEMQEKLMHRIYEYHKRTLQP